MLYNIFRRVVYSTKYVLKESIVLPIECCSNNNLFLYHFINIFLCAYNHCCKKIPISIFLLTKTILSVKLLHIPLGNYVTIDIYC